MPHLALPTLTALLRRAGVAVTQRDLNIETFDALLTPLALETARQRVQHRLRDPLERSEREHLLGVLTAAEELVEDIELAKKTLRGPAFYEPDENLGAMLTVMDALELASAPYFPNALSWYGVQSSYRPDSTVGILQAIRDGHHNMFLELFEQTVLPKLEADPPDIVGISLTTIHQVLPGLTLVALIKRRLPQIHIVLGGKMVTAWREELPKRRQLFDLADSAVYFEGEPALLRLIEALDSGDSLANVPNLIYRQGEKIYMNPPEVAADLEAMPLPDYEGLPLDRYLAPQRILPIEACRGCYWRRCAFCNLGYGQSRNYRARPPEYIAAEMASLQQRYGTRFFFFVDEALPPAMLAGLSEAISARGLDLYWAACVRFEPRIEPSLLHAMRDAGCRMLMYGLESGVQRILDRIDKGTTLQTVGRILRQAREAGIWNHIFVFFGFPGETEDEAQQTIHFTHDHLEDIHSIAGGTFILEKYSQIYQQPAAFGVKVLREQGIDLAFQYPYQVTSGQTAKEALRSLQRFQEILDARRIPRVFFDDVYDLLYAVAFEDPKMLWSAPGEPTQ